MPGYETTIVLRSAAGEDQKTALKSKLESILSAEGGELCNHEDWGTRKLAFTRKRENKGNYQFFAYTGKNSTVAEIERNLRINENVILFLSILKNAGESSEDLAALKEASAMTKPRERAIRPSFHHEGGGGGRGSFRDEGSRSRE